MNEIWKDIYFEEGGIVYDYRGLYQVSNFGNIKSLNYNRTKKEKILKATKNNDGYYQVKLYKDRKQKKFLIHRLVAYAFIENDDPNNKTYVNHINEFEKNNNIVTNLEWCTIEYNNNYGTRNKRAIKSNIKIRSKKVIGYSLTETKVIIIQSTKQGKSIGFNPSHIADCCRGERKSHKGYKWKYFNDRDFKED